jgi:hypothetical protein
MRKVFNKSSQFNKKSIEKRFGKGAKLVDMRVISKNRFSARVIKK